VLATFVTMLIFCPFAFYCIYRSFKSRKEIETLIGNSVRNTIAEQDATSNGGQRPSLNSGFPPRRG
jgi:hypothetical protein